MPLVAEPHAARHFARIVDDFCLLATEHPLNAWRRPIALLVTGLCLGVFHFGPGFLRLDDSTHTVWLAGPGIILPLLAACLSFWAAAQSHSSDRSAWLNFGIGSVLYFIGNLYYVYIAIEEIQVQFPTLPELSFFVMAVFFTLGMFQYGAARHLISRIQTYNFGLVLCAVAIAAAFLLHRSIALSQLTTLGTVFAFAYPVLWFSVAGFGLVCLLLYAPSSKRFAFSLLLLGVLFEAVADFVYARALMDGNFQPGGLSSDLWTLSTMMVIGAAIEQMSLLPLAVRVDANVPTLNRRRMAEATLPALAVAAVLGSASVSVGLTGYGALFLFFSIPFVILFPLLIGTREHWSLSLERDLKTAALRSETELSASRQRLSSVLESTAESVLVLDRELRVLYFNRQAVQTVGGNNPLVVGETLADVFPVDVADSMNERLRGALATSDAIGFEQYLPAGSLWLDVHAFPSPDGVSIFFRDISEAHRVREEITYLAHHDPLTGLANRILFHEEVRKGIASSGSVATLFLDLDHFKEVNDTLGHPVGDALLGQLAIRLTGCVGSSDTVGRLGGDEFAVVQPGIKGKAEASELAQRMLAEIRKPYVIDGQTVRVSGTVGIALTPSDGTDPDQIFKNADIALYCAKDEERGTYRFFEPAMEVRLQTKQRLKVDLAAALAASELELAFQPIINLHDNRISRFEALLRWHHPVHHEIAPSVFIPIAEETGLIVPIGRWVLEQACWEASKWPSAVAVAVNLSPVQFNAIDLPEMVKSILDQTGLAPERLELEITESVLLHDSALNLQTLNRLRAVGVRIALDDFGTGYASLGYLQKFPFSRIKIDRSFVGHEPEKIESRAILGAVTGLGHALGIRITAEGVETRQQLDRVRKVECDEAQGYFFSKPVAATDIPDLLEKLASTQKFWGDPVVRRPPSAA